MVFMNATRKQTRPAHVSSPQALISAVRSDWAKRMEKKKLWPNYWINPTFGQFGVVIGGWLVENSRDRTYLEQEGNWDVFVLGLCLKPLLFSLVATRWATLLWEAIIHDVFVAICCFDWILCDGLLFYTWHSGCIDSKEKTSRSNMSNHFRSYRRAGQTPVLLSGTDWKLCVTFKPWNVADFRCAENFRLRKEQSK